MTIQIPYKWDGKANLLLQEEKKWNTAIGKLVNYLQRKEPRVGAHTKLACEEAE